MVRKRPRKLQKNDRSSTAMRMKEEYIVRRMLDVDKPGKRRSKWPNLRCNDASKIDMTEAGLKEDNSTLRAEWRKKIISYTGDPR